MHFCATLNIDKVLLLPSISSMLLRAQTHTRQIFECAFVERETSKSRSPASLVCSAFDTTPLFFFFFCMPPVKHVRLPGSNLTKRKDTPPPPSPPKKMKPTEEGWLVFDLFLETPALTAGKCFVESMATGNTCRGKGVQGELGHSVCGHIWATAECTHTHTLTHPSSEAQTE